MTDDYIYLDNAAATFIDPSAHKALIDAFTDDHINLSGNHPLAIAMNKRIEECRQNILDWLQASSDYQVVFTSSATESNNTVIRGLDLQAGDLIAYSEADHPSQSQPCKAWHDHDIQLATLPLQANGLYDIDTFIEQTTQAPRLICLTQVSSLAGTYNDCDQAAKALKQAFPDCHIHVDAAQALTKMPVSLTTGAIDSLAIASYKLGGPKGIAALIIKKNAPLNPLLLGGQQEYGRRASSTATPLIIGFHQALQSQLDQYQPHHEQACKLNQLTRDQLSGSQVQFPFTREETSPYVLLLLVPGIAADIISRHLEAERIIVNTRTSCSAKNNKPTPMLAALHIPTALHRHAIRVSFSHHNTAEDIERFCNVLRQTINLLSALKK